MGMILTSGNFFADSTLEANRWKRQLVVGAPGALVGIATVLTNTGSVGVPAATSTASSGSSFTTGGVSGNSSGQLFDAIHSVNHNLRAVWQITVSSTTLCRYQLGYCNTTVANMVAGDTPAFSYMGFRFSTAVPDTNWQCLTDNGSGTPTVKDSGVAVAAGEYVLGILYDSVAGAANFFINRQSSVALTPKLVAITTTTLPAVATLMSQFAGIATLENVAKTFNVHFMNSRSRIL